MTRYALLALLRDGPDYGYRLKRRFEETMGPAVRLSHSYVYQALRTLVRQGLLVELPPTREDPRYPERRPFAISERGVQRLDRWLAQRPPARVAQSRVDTLIRALWATPDAPPFDAVRLHLDAQERMHRQRLTRLLGARRRLSAHSPIPLLADLAIEGEVLELRAQLDWVALCRRQILAACEAGRAAAAEDRPRQPRPANAVEVDRGTAPASRRARTSKRPPAARASGLGSADSLVDERRVVALKVCREHLPQQAAGEEL